MFSLESYITPILLSHVEKYVKNVRAETSQVSLWGGEAVFNNLDLRLDVLERELGLPFSIVSGHIHELRIRVPWTRLQSEPIVITINTIECVLKLPGAGDAAVAAGDARSSSSKSRRSHRRAESAGGGGGKQTGQPGGEAVGPPPPAGYLQSLISKIISNVTIVCNNLILKYVEEDIVFSLNTRHLKLCSANEIWEPAFTDLAASAPHFILRKLLRVTDLTICLDRRTSSGKIESYLEPLLYRCSFDVHAAWVYASAAAKTATISRIEIRCHRLDFSLTDTQIPMFLRLLHLVLALYYGDIAKLKQKAIEEARREEKPEATAIQMDPHGDAADDGAHDTVGLNDSWSGWAWNVGASVGSALLPVYWEDEDPADSADGGGPAKFDELRDKVLHFGFYVDSASLVLKLSDFVGHSSGGDRSKASFGAAKLVFSPFARIDAVGLYVESIVKGMGWANVTAGLSGLSVFPVAECHCGVTDTVAAPPAAAAKAGDEPEPAAPFVVGGKPSPSKSGRSFARGSLFEKDFGDEEGLQSPKERRRDYPADWDAHLAETSEAALLERTPAFALDYLYHVEIPEDVTSEYMSELEFNLEESDLPERALCRLIFGPLSVSVCSGLLHRSQTLLHLSALYDYTPYTGLLDGYEPADSKSSTPRGDGGPRETEGPAAAEESAESVVANSPIRVYQVTAINPQVRLYAANHARDINLQHVRQSRASSSLSARLQTGGVLGADDFRSLPFVVLRAECVDAQFSQPMYERRVATHMAALCRPFSPSAVQSASLHFNAKLMHTSVSLGCGGDASVFLRPTSLNVAYRQLVAGVTDAEDAVKREFSGELKSLSLQFTRPQIMLLLEIVGAYREKEPRPRKLRDTTLVEDAVSERSAGLPRLGVGVYGLRAAGVQTNVVVSLEASLENAMVHLSVALQNAPETSTPIITRVPPTPLLSQQKQQQQLLRSPYKMSPGRASLLQKRPSTDLHEGPFAGPAQIWESHLVQAYVQFPTESDHAYAAEARQHQPPLLVAHVAPLHSNADPKLFDWLLYAPTVKRLPLLPRPGASTAGGVPARRPPSVSSSGVASGLAADASSAPKIIPESSVRSTSASGYRSLPQQALVYPAHRIPAAKKFLRTERGPPVDSHRACAGILARWFRSLNATLVQVNVEAQLVHIPQKSLFPFSGKSVAETVDEANRAGSSIPILTLRLPSVCLENVAHTPSVQQFLATKPVSIPESVWNPRRDNLPWTLKFFQLSMFVEGKPGATAGVEYLLQPVDASCTLSLSLSEAGKSDRTAPAAEFGAALAIHTDIGALRFTVSQKHLKLLLTFVEETIAMFAKLYPSILLFPDEDTGGEGPGRAAPRRGGGGRVPEETGGGSERSHRPPQTVISERTSETSTGLQQHAVKPSLAAVMDKSASPDESPLSLWIQWTLPMIAVTLITDVSPAPQRLALEIENCQSSLDWNRAYLKAKYRVQSVSVRTSVKPGGGGDWVRSEPNLGVALSCADDITCDLATVNPQANVLYLLPHSRHFYDHKDEQAVFRLTLTRVDANSLSRRWAEATQPPVGDPAMKERPARARSSSSSDRVAGADPSPAKAKFVAEIDAELAPLDLVVSPKNLMPFIEMAASLTSVKLPPGVWTLKQPKKKASEKRDVVPPGLALNNTNLPLIHFKASTLRLWMVPDSLAAKEPAEFDYATAPDCCLLQVDSIVVTPDVQNPLPRTILRPELVTAPGGELSSVPGARMEDRQYEATVSGVGLFTGRWRDVHKRCLDHQGQLDIGLKTMGQNPAFEWNTNDALSRRQQEKREVILLPAFSQLDFQLRLAPAMVLWKEGEAAPLLVAGHSAEIGAQRAVNVCASLAQVAFFSRLVEANLALALRVASTCRENLAAASFPASSRQKADDGADLDSGVPSGVFFHHRQPSAVAEPDSDWPWLYPLEVLVSSGKITFSAFKLVEGEKAAILRDKKATERRRRRREISDTQSRVRLLSGRLSEEKEAAATATPAPGGPDWEASEEGSLRNEESLTTLKIYPLFLVSLDQPHCFLRLDEGCQRFEVGLFDLAFNLAPSDYFVTCGGKRLPEPLDYTSYWLQTKPGDADPRTGVPPPLVTFAVRNFLAVPASVHLDVERPVKIDLGLDLQHQGLGYVREVREAAAVFRIYDLLSPPPTPQPAPSPSCVPSPNLGHLIRERAASLDSVSVSTKQVVFHLPITDKETLTNVELVAGVMGTRLDLAIKSKAAGGGGAVKRLDSASLRAQVDRLLARVSISGIAHPFLSPTSFDVSAALSFLPHVQSPVVRLTVESEPISLTVGPNHGLALSFIQKELFDTSAVVEGAPATAPSAEPVTGAAAFFFPPYEPVEHTFIDDLRAGAFQYVTGGGGGSAAIDPKPYQVVFDETDPASPSATWKYPSPRTLTRVSVFPLPLTSASESGKAHGIPTIACSLQYKEACAQGAFLDYGKFVLSETQAHHLNLPVSTDWKQCAVSDTWRVVIHQYDDDDAEEEDPDAEGAFVHLQSGGGSSAAAGSRKVVIVRPQSLVSALRVDSYFNPAIVPAFQAALTVPKVTLKVTNDYHFYSHQINPRDLGNFILSPSFPPVLHAITLESTSNRVSCEFWSSREASRLFVRSKLTPSLSIVDMSYLATHHVVEPFGLQSRATFSRRHRKERTGKAMSLDVNMESRSVAVRYGSFAHETLRTVVDNWTVILRQTDRSMLDPGLCRYAEGGAFARPMTTYTVCNNTTAPVRFGQADTDENILLKPQECLLYSWRSLKARPALKVCSVADGAAEHTGATWRWSRPFSVQPAATTEKPPKSWTFVAEPDGPAIPQAAPIVIRCKRLEGTRVQIVINGALAAASLLKDHLELRVVPNDQSDAAPVTEQRVMLPSYSATPSFLVNPDSTAIRGVKIRLLGIGTPWSGEIPLHLEKTRKKSSVLVRVPTKEKGSSVTVWCRVIKEKVSDAGVFRLLLLVSPMYTARSLLPNPVKVLVSGQRSASVASAVANSPRTTEVTIPGRECPTQLEAFGPSDQKYELRFQVVASLPPSDPVTVSWGIIEQVRPPAKEDRPQPASAAGEEVIESILRDLHTFSSSGEASRWPYITEEAAPEEGVDGGCGAAAQEPVPPVAYWASNDQPQTDVQINFVPFHPWCNTLCIEVNPWCLLVNQLGLDLFLLDAGGGADGGHKMREISLLNDSVLVPPQLDSTFQLGLLVAEGERCLTPPLQLSDQEWRFRNRLMPAVQGLIPKEGIIHTKIVIAAAKRQQPLAPRPRIVFVTIQSRNENGVRVIRLLPSFNVTNCLSSSLMCAPLVACDVHADGSATKRIAMTGLTLDGEAVEASPRRTTPLLFWEKMTSTHEEERSSDHVPTFDGFQFLSFKLLRDDDDDAEDETEWSAPLSLDDCRYLETEQRRSVFLRKRPPPAGQPRDPTSPDNAAVLLTVHQLRGQVFFVVRDNDRPAIHIYNGLDVPLEYGESLPNRRGVPHDYSIFDDPTAQSVAPNASCLYQLPWIDEHFPFKDPPTEWPRLVLSRSASVVAGPPSQEAEWEMIASSDRRWSVGIDVHRALECFIALPGYGDIKVSVELIESTAHVFIDPVTKSEVSARDIRGRFFSSASTPIASPKSPDFKTPEPLLPSPRSESSEASSAFIAVDAATPRVDSRLFQDCVDETDPGGGFQSPVSVPVSRYHSAVELGSPAGGGGSVGETPFLSQLSLSASVLVETVSLVLSDDCVEDSARRDEYLRLSLDGVCLSLRPQFFYRQLFRALNAGLAEMTQLEVSFANVQLDNQMFRRYPFEFPIVVLGEREPDAADSVNPLHLSGKFQLNDAVLEALRRRALVSVCFELDSSRSVVRSVLRSVRIRVDPLAAFIEDKFLYKLATVAAVFSPSASASAQQMRRDPFDARRLPLVIELGSANLAHQLRLETFVIEPIDVKLSVRASIKMHIGLDQSPLTFSRFKRTDLLTTHYALGQMIAKHFVSGALFRAGWVFGSLDIIGSPSGFTRSVGDGVVDFVSLPYRGIANGPWAFVSGVASGSSSLVKHVSAGTLSSMTNFASSVSRNMDRLSLDDEHVRRNDMFRRDVPQGLGQGLANGLSGVGLSLLGAVGGIIHHPISAVLATGASPSGLARGVTRGLVGVVTKPLGGAAEFVAQTGQGLLYGSGWSRHYEPRFLDLGADENRVDRFKNSDLKSEWKLLPPETLAASADANFRRGSLVLFIADCLLVERGNKGGGGLGSGAHVTLVLTHQRLYVVSQSEDSVVSSFEVLETECRVCPEDPTKVSFFNERRRRANPTTAGESTINYLAIQDRIVEFITSAAPHLPAGPSKQAGAPSSAAEGPSPADEKGPEEHVFAASPLVIACLRQTYETASRQLRHRGFDIL